MDEAVHPPMTTESGGGMKMYRRAVWWTKTALVAQNIAIMIMGGVGVDEEHAIMIMVALAGDATEEEEEEVVDAMGINPKELVHLVGIIRTADTTMAAVGGRMVITIVIMVINVQIHQHLLHLH